MFVWPKMRYVRAKIGLTGQFDRCQLGIICSPAHISELFKFVLGGERCVNSICLYLSVNMAHLEGDIGGQVPIMYHAEFF